MPRRKFVLARAARVALVISLLILAAWAISTRLPAGYSFDRWRLESYGGTVVLLVWGTGPEYRTSADYVRGSVGQWGFERPEVVSSAEGVLHVTVPYWVICAPALFVCVTFAVLSRIFRRPLARPVQAARPEPAACPQPRRADALTAGRIAEEPRSR